MAARRPVASGSNVAANAAAGEPERLIQDRTHYIAFLEVSCDV